MCTTPDSQPPAPRVTGRMASSQGETLTGPDGTAVAAHVATSTGERPGVVIVPDVRGLHHFYEHLAEVTAGAGLHAVSIDFYGRTAGAERRAGDFDYAPHRAEVRDDALASDVAAGVARLRDLGATRTYVWGFCFGGRAAFLQASNPAVDGVIGCYGWPTRAGDTGNSPLKEARNGQVTAPVLAIYGGGDAKITADDRESYGAALEAAGVAHETVVYPGAPHSFFDKKMAEHAEACDDVWRRVLAFTGVS